MNKYTNIRRENNIEINCNITKKNCIIKEQIN